MKYIKIILLSLLMTAKAGTSMAQNESGARSFSVSLTYRLGSLKASVKKTGHSIDNDDVVGGQV